MLQSGSAVNLELHGDYNNQDVTVNNLQNFKFVIFNGDDINDLTLDHTSVVGTINFSMAQALPFGPGGVQNIDALHVTVGNVLNMQSTGNADSNLITDVSDVNANVSLFTAAGTTSVALTFGSEAGAYDFANGIIDAAGFTASLNTFIGAGSQTVIGGTGNDKIDVMTNQAGLPDLIQLSGLGGGLAGGNDIVEFHATNPDATDLVTPANYTNITGFSVGGPSNDIVNLDVQGGININLFSTNGTALVGGEAVAIYPMQTNGPDDNLAGVNLNFIKIQTDQTSVGFSLQGIFNFAMGTTNLAVNAAVDAGGGEILMAFHDQNAANGGQIVLFTVDPGANNSIDAGDDVDMVSLIGGQSFTDFLAFGGGQLAFVA
jgi:hypothetical protein